MIPELHPDARNAIELIAVACIVLATFYKLLSLYRHTRRWNGLGRALRDEKWAYIAAWSWLVLRDYLPVLDRSVVFLAVATAIIVTEVRTVWYVPRVWIRHDRPPGGPTV